MKLGPLSVRPPLPPVRQRAIDDVDLRIHWEDGSSTVHAYRPGIAEYLTTRYTRAARDAGQVTLVIAYEHEKGAQHDDDRGDGGGRAAGGGA